MLLLCWLGGCVKVGPDFAPPTTPVPEGWLAAQNGSQAAAPDLSQWWRVFADPALDRLVAAARTNNPDLQAAGLRVLQARTQLGVASSQLYPQVQQSEGNWNTVRQSDRSPTAPQPGQPRRDMTLEQLNLGLAASWELDFWGKFRRGVEAAEAEFAAGLAAYDNALVSLTGDVARTYIQLRLAQERLRIARDNEAVQRESLRIAQVRFDLGVAAERDVQQATSLLAATMARVPDLEIGLAQSRHALSLLLGLAPSTLEAELSPTQGRPAVLPEAPLEVAVGIPAEVLRRRPDVRRAEALAAAQSARIGVAQAEFYPALSLSGNIGFAASDVGAFQLSEIFSHGFTAGFMPAFRWPLFNYGRISNNVRLQDARFQEQLANHRSVVLGALREVEDGLVALLRSRERVDILGQGTRAARRSVDLALVQYQEGAADFVTVLTAQQDLLQQEDNLAVSRGATALALVGLYRALGGGWEQRPELVPAEIRETMARRTNWGRLLDERPPQTPDSPPATPVWRAPDW